MQPFRILVALTVLPGIALTVLPGIAAPPSADAAKRGAQSHRTPAHTVVSSAKTPAPVRAAAAVGRRYWGVMPCSGQIRFASRRPLAPGVVPGTDAWVTFDSSLGANNVAAPAASYRRCEISLGRSRWPTSASMSQDWNMLCTTMIHEMGHLLGHSHELRRGSVMAPVFDDGSSVPSMCRQTRPRAAR